VAAASAAPACGALSEFLSSARRASYTQMMPAWLRELYTPNPKDLVEYLLWFRSLLLTGWYRLCCMKSLYSSGSEKVLLRAGACGAAAVSKERKRL
jgi:hypothetical protein